MIWILSMQLVQVGVLVSIAFMIEDIMNELKEQRK